MSYALARGMLAAGLTITAAMTVGIIVTIGGVAFAAAFARDRFMGLLVRTENWRHYLGSVLEVGSSAAMLGFGVWTAGECGLLSLLKRSFRPAIEGFYETVL